MKATPQSAIIPDHCRAGIFMEADFITTDTHAIAHACQQALVALGQLQDKFADSSLGLTIGFGATAWQSFGHGDEGSQIKPFRPLGNGLAPATQHDLLFHIQSLRHDINFSLAKSLAEIFANIADIKTETHGFRWVENRGLEGFVDGTENPQGDDIPSVAAIGDGADAGGSYVLLQKYRHDLHKWDKLPVCDQEDCVGRSKADNVEFDKAKRLADSHLGRTNLKENGKTLEIVRRSLPYGTVTGEHGLMFIAYAARLWNIEAQLLSMFGETDGKIDLLLKHVSTAVSGAYYYAPSVERLQNLANTPSA
ncbi:putative iron-dependent peroxidase [Moraxella cuniculi DSM 21768]|uniref:Probable deferrochelatase/peroxidase YfeX n=2 Tax=Moraxella cuniculi TaxID=34061 RepID=A0A448GTN2_9GAMM|nr:Dyp-type peroxidase [Moraxella cuniculi]OOS06432.1 peroxidase [Moraxella cuniculi]SIR96005.1 putative iron-dependent peroxidase [Moraxella cuniculi DSM 21768]VEG12164.1 Probable deferrochelatase/peroxidase YfeX [Moraxella cuniculi]